MSQPIEPIRHKMTEAMPPAPAEEPQAPEPVAEHDHLKAGMKEHNASVQPEYKDRLVDVGRGRDTRGRGDQ